MEIVENWAMLIIIHNGWIILWFAPLYITMHQQGIIDLDPDFLY
jgi:hypothetical protein